LYTIFALVLKGQKKEKNFSACQRNLNFGVFLALAHYRFSAESYSTLIEMRRMIPLHSSNVLTPAVGMRLLNCFAYVLFATFTMISESRKTEEVPVDKTKEKQNTDKMLEKLSAESRQLPPIIAKQSQFNEKLFPSQKRKMD